MNCADPIRSDIVFFSLKSGTIFKTIPDFNHRGVGCARFLQVLEKKSKVRYLHSQSKKKAISGTESFLS